MVPMQSTSTPRLSVAPMIDWTDTHCRTFHRICAPGALLYTEMIHANAILKGDRDKLLAKCESQHPVAVQLGGAEPDALAGAAAICAAAGFDEINLNCGCPSDRVLAGRFGACLMHEPALVARLVSDMRAAVPAHVPVTVKCRLGVDDDNDFDTFLAFIDTVAEGGCTAFVIHARNAWLKGLSPKENREIPPLKYDWAYRLKQLRPTLRITLNGGISDLASIQTHLAQLDGVMLGRAAYHTPYVLHEIDAALHGGAVRTRAALLESFRPYVQSKLAEGVPLPAMTRHILGLFQGEPGGRKFRQVLSEGAHQAGADWSLVEAAMAAQAATASDLYRIR